MVRINQQFWSSAVYEFKQTIALDLDTFERLEVVVPKSMLPEIVKALHDGYNQISAALAKTVSQQSVFSGREKCQFLLDASVEKIGVMKERLLEEKSSNAARGQQLEKALSVMVRIEDQKRRLQRKLEAAALLKTDSGAISADQLLEAMFQRVFSEMYLPHWPAVEPAAWSGKSDMRLDITTYQATM
jgi:hypothetical protein